MRHAVLSALVSLSLVGCATQQAEQKTEKAPPKPTTETFHVTNVSTFDLGNCFPMQVEVPKPVTSGSLQGFLAAARPQLDECLVDPQNRGHAENTQVTVEATVTDSGPQYQATGDNLTPAGAECMVNALKSRTGLDGLAKGAKPVTAKLSLTHTVGVNPAVTFGSNELNDAVGKVRLALPQWCECFEPWHSSPPHSLPAELELSKTSPTPVGVTFPPGADDATTQVETCLTGKIKAMPLTTTRNQLKVPLSLLFLHSGIDEPLASTEQPAVVRGQYDAISIQTSANQTIAAGARQGAFDAYNALVDKYQANPSSVTVKQLKNTCQALLNADDALLASLQRSTEHMTKVQEAARAHAGQAEWKDAESAAQQQIDANAQDTANIKAARASDAAACPKVR